MWKSPLQKPWPTIIAFPARHKGRSALYTNCGILMHFSLVITRDGLPLGLAAIKFWSRNKFHRANALKRRINPTRVPIEQKESIRWLQNLRQATELLGDQQRCAHIGDRESDIYELFCLAQELDTHFLVRTCVDGLAEEGATTVVAQMRESKVQVNRSGWRRRLYDSVTARAAHLYAHMANHLEGLRDMLKVLRHIFAQLTKLLASGRRLGPKRALMLYLMRLVSSVPR